MAAESFSRWFLAVFFLAVAVFYTVSISLKTRRTGASPVTFGRFRTRHWLIHTTFRVFRGLILAVCLIRVPYPTLDRYLVPFEPLWSPAILLAGNAMMLASFAGLIWLHRAMGSHWRSGIPEGDVRPLITKGVYAFSRNPMFLLFQAAQLGFFFSLPSLFTLVCLAVGVTAIHAQVRLEERYLANQHGEAYARYKRATPRWLIPRRRR
jgi:protein-S-isoprenylcysteine O-methyltransferase Ste14